MKKDKKITSVMLILLLLVSLLYLTESSFYLTKSDHYNSLVFALLSFSAGIIALGWHLKRRSFIWLSISIFFIQFINSLIRLITNSTEITTSLPYSFYILSFIISIFGIIAAINSLKKINLS